MDYNYYKDLLSDYMQSSISMLKGEHQYDQTDVADLLGKVCLPSHSFMTVCNMGMIRPPSSLEGRQV